MRSKGSSCALTAVLLLAGAGFFALAGAAPAQNSAFQSGTTATAHSLVDLIAQASADGRSRSDVKHLRNALNQVLHVMEKNGSGKKGSMGKGAANMNPSGNARPANAANAKNGGAVNAGNKKNAALVNPVAANAKSGGPKSSANNLAGRVASNAPVNTGANAKNNRLGNNASGNFAANAPNNAKNQTRGGTNVYVHVTIGAAPGNKAGNVRVNVSNARNGPANGGAANNATASNLAKSFPNLGSNYKVLDATNKNYNCVSYTLGDKKHWIDPKTGPANAPLAPMDKLYAQQGFQRQKKLDLSPDPKSQKIALYATKKPDGSINKVTHAALQQPNGTWTSKLGHLPLVQHSSPYSVAGNTYGVPVATYTRPLAGNSVGHKATNRTAANRKR